MNWVAVQGSLMADTAMTPSLNAKTTCVSTTMTYVTALMIVGMDRMRNMISAKVTPVIKSISSNVTTTNVFHDTLFAMAKTIVEMAQMKTI